MIVQFLELIKIDRENVTPIFRQLIDQMIHLIRSRILQPGSQIPGSRRLASHLELHRKTVIAAIDELVAQGWLQTIPGKGTFVAKAITSDYDLFDFAYPSQDGALHIEIPQIIDRDIPPSARQYHLDDGLPDPRLAPVDHLIRAYKSALTKGWKYPKYTYGDTRGQTILREAMCEYLARSRGITINADQILVTRGVTQALYLTIKAFIQKGDFVAIGELSWESAKVNFLYHGAELVRIKVDREGLDVDHLERVCQERKIRMVYVTPHHQYPTTVIMPAYRRVKLLQLSRQHGFFLFEDDYDYDFHYSRHPIMPLAAAEHQGQVLYAGSFTKAISPVFRIGYLVGTPEQIDYLAKLRRLVDRQGDAILELAIAEMLKMEVIQRYLRKNKRIYQSRRDYFAARLKTLFPGQLDFDLPEGGMSIWVQFSPEINLKEVAGRALQRDLYFYDGSGFKLENRILNATRLGFASSTFVELEIATTILQKLLPKSG